MTARRNVLVTEEFADRGNVLRRVNMSLNTLARDYELLANDVVCDFERWMTECQGLFEQLFESFNEFVVSARMVLIV